MGAITSVNDLVAGARPVQGFAKLTPATLSVGNWSSCWLTGGQPGGGSVPPAGGGAAANAATAGALPLPALNSGQDVYLSAIDLTAPQGCTVMVADRLVASGGLSGIVTTAQAVGTPALDARWPDAVGVMMALEVYVALGATAVTATVSYTNQAGVAGRTTTVGIPANAPVGRFLFVPLTQPDTGVQSVQSVTLSATTGTAGNFGVTLFRAVTILSPPVANVGASKDFAALGPVDVGSAAASAACLFLLMLPSATTAGTLTGSYVPVVK